MPGLSTQPAAMTRETGADDPGLGGSRDELKPRGFDGVLGKGWKIWRLMGAGAGLLDVGQTG